MNLGVMFKANRFVAISFYLTRELLLSFVRTSPVFCCFFRFGFPMAAGSSNGPDQVATPCPFWYGNTVVNEEGSGGSNAGSMWCDEPRG